MRRARLQLAEANREKSALQAALDRAADQQRTARDEFAALQADCDDLKRQLEQGKGRGAALCLRALRASCSVTARGCPPALVRGCSRCAALCLWRWSDVPMCHSLRAQLVW